MSRAKSKKSIRHSIISRRKNFFPALIISITGWTSLSVLVYFFNPNSSLNIFLFFLILFISLIFTLSLILKNTKRGFLVSLGLTVFAIFRYFGIGNLLNLILIIAIIATLEIYQKFS